jgi:hypothetical protein
MQCISGPSGIDRLLGVAIGLFPCLAVDSFASLYYHSLLGCTPFKQHRHLNITFRTGAPNRLTCRIRARTLQAEVGRRR